MEKTVASLVYGDLVKSEVHGQYVRFARMDGSYIVVMDRNTLVELPDYVHPTQITVA